MEEWLTDTVMVAVRLVLTVASGVDSAVTLKLGLAVPVTLELGVPVALEDALPVWDGDGVPVVELLGVLEKEGVSADVCSGAQDDEKGLR